MSTQVKSHVVKVQRLPARAICQGRKGGRCVNRCTQDGGFVMTTGVFDKCGNDLARGLAMSGQRNADGVEKRPLCLGHRTDGQLLIWDLRNQARKLFSDCHRAFPPEHKLRCRDLLCLPGLASVGLGESPSVRVAPSGRSTVFAGGGRGVPCGDAAAGPRLKEPNWQWLSRTTPTLSTH